MENIIHTFHNSLSSDEKEWYLEILSELIMKIEPRYTDCKLFVIDKIKEQLAEYIKNPDTKFLITYIGDQIVAIMVCIGLEFQSQNYIRIAQLAISKPIEYLTIGKKMIEYIHKKYPDAVLYGFIRLNNRFAREMVQMIGGRMDKDIRDPNYDYDDGWRAYIYMQAE